MGVYDPTLIRREQRRESLSSFQLVPTTIDTAKVNFTTALNQVLTSVRNLKQDEQNIPSLLRYHRSKITIKLAEDFS